MLRAGIIGLGVGESHIDGFNGHPQCKVTAICDNNRSRLREVGEKHPSLILTTTDEDILTDPDIDIVSIASYDNYHAHQVVRALENGKHVFVEKPICLSEKEAVWIRETLNKHPRLKLSSNLILRRSPRFLELRELIGNGTMGTVFHVEGDYNYGRLKKITDGWRGDIPFYSVVYGGGVHIIDLLLWLTGDTVVEVSAKGNNICSAGSKFKYNDMVISLLAFKSGMTGKMTANFGCVYPHFHQLQIYGTQATFINGRSNAILYRSRDPEVQPVILTSEYPGIRKGDLLYDFVDAILNDKQPEVSADDVFRSMSVCFAIEKAVSSSKIVTVTYL